MHNYQLNIRSCHYPDCDYGRQSLTLGMQNFCTWTSFPQISIEMWLQMGNIFFFFICYSPAMVDPYWEKLPEVLSTTLGRRPREVLIPRAQFLPIRIDQGLWITFLFFSYWHLKVSGRFYFSLQPIYVEVERVRVDEARDRLQTKTKHTMWFLACNLHYHNSALSSLRIKKRFCVLVDNS